MVIAYLQKLYDMEKNKFLLQRLIQAENDKIRNIDGQIANISAERNQPIVYEPMPKEVKQQNIGAFLGGVFIGVFVFIIPAFIITAIVTGVLDITDFVDGCLIWLFISLTLSILFAISGRSGNKRLYLRYLQEVEQVKKRNEEITKQKEFYWSSLDNKVAELSKISERCRSNIDTLNRQLFEVEEMLKQYYDVGILYDKYHYMEAVCKMLEYLQSGRCTTLYGPSGVYDTYEKEYRTDIVIDRLDKVLYKMDEIRNTNIRLYQAIQRVGMSVNQVHQGISEQLRTLEAQFGDSIGLLEKNAEATRTLAEISETNSRNLAELAEYQNFATKQQRLSEGHWS